jgi:hypothetical protein
MLTVYKRRLEEVDDKYLDDAVSDIEELLSLLQVSEVEASLTRAQRKIAVDAMLEIDRLRATILTAAEILHASFGKPGRLVAKAAGEARRVLNEAVPREKGQDNGHSPQGA